MNISLLIIFCVLVYAAYSDWKYRKVKNILVFPVFFIGLGWNFVANGINGGVDAFWGGVVPLLLFIFYAMRMLGAADIKLLMAIGAWLGLRQTSFIMIYSILCGGLIAIAIIIVQKDAISRIRKLGQYMKACILTRKILPYEDFKRIEKGAAMPFAIAILAGFLYHFATIIKIAPGI